MYKYNTMNTLNIAENTFYEKINIAKLNFILSNQSQYENIIQEQKKDMLKVDKNYNAYAVFQKNQRKCIYSPRI
jgi:hypothetical protein